MNEYDTVSDAKLHVERLRRQLDVRTIPEPPLSPPFPPQDWEQFANDLKLLRNRCAHHGREYCISLVQLGFLDILCQTIQVFVAHPHVPDQVGIRTGQLLANFITAGGDDQCTHAAWSALFPHHLSALCEVSIKRQVPAVASSLALSLVVWSKYAGAAVVADLVSSAGIGLLAQLLSISNNNNDGEVNENIRLLFGQLVFVHESLKPMYLSLTDLANGRQFNITLLRLLADETRLAPDGRSNLSVCSSRSINNGTPDQEHKSIAFLVLLLREHKSDADVVQSILSIINQLSARDDGGAGLVHHVRADMVGSAVKAGIIALVLDELRALIPPLSMSELYAGYRSDLLAVLGNMTYNRSYVQEEVCKRGGVEIVLSQCQRPRTDPYAASPLAREWALWTIRNLCQGSEEAQNAIANLQLLQVLDSEELERANVKVKVDEESGKLRIGKRNEI